MPFEIGYFRTRCEIPPLPLYSGGEGRGEGAQNPAQKPQGSARAGPLTPNPSPPEYRRRGEESEICRLETPLTFARAGLLAALAGEQLTSASVEQTKQGTKAPAEIVASFDG